MAKKPIQFRLNGADEAIFVADGQNLLDFLRQAEITHAFVPPSMPAPSTIS